MGDYSAAWCEENPGAASITIERLRNEAQRHRVRREQEKIKTIEECARVAEERWKNGPYYAQSAAQGCATAIRALKDKPLLS